MKKTSSFTHLFTIAALAIFTLVFAACGGTKKENDVPKDAKLLVSKMTDQERINVYEYDLENRLKTLKSKSLTNIGDESIDSISYDGESRIMKRVLVHKSNRANYNYTKTSVYNYRNDTIVIQSDFSNGEASTSDTITIDHQGRLISDRYYTYDYDINSNGYNMIEQTGKTNNTENEVIQENIKRFEYDEKISPFININIPDWFIVHQLHLFEYVGKNNPKSITHQIVETRGETKRILNSDIEKITAEYNNAGYPTEIMGEDDSDGMWKVSFEYIEMK